MQADGSVRRCASLGFKSSPPPPYRVIAIFPENNHDVNKTEQNRRASSLNEFVRLH